LQHCSWHTDSAVPVCEPTQLVSSLSETTNPSVIPNTPPRTSLNDSHPVLVKSNLVPDKNTTHSIHMPGSFTNNRHLRSHPGVKSIKMDSIYSQWLNPEPRPSMTQYAASHADSNNVSSSHDNPYLNNAFARSYGNRSTSATETLAFPSLLKSTFISSSSHNLSMASAEIVKKNR
jgi:hypothetical protein